MRRRLLAARRAPLLVALTLVTLLGACNEEFTPPLPYPPLEPPRLYGVNSSDKSLSIIDPATGEARIVGALDPAGDPSLTPIAMAVSPSGEIFTWVNSRAGMIGGFLMKVDRVTGAATLVDPAAPPQGQVSALAFSADGRLYGLDVGLFAIDPETGVSTTIRGLGHRFGGADFHPITGVLYASSLVLGEGSLYTIDVATGAVTPLPPLSQPVDLINSIVFDPAGRLLCSASLLEPDSHNIFMEIDPATGICTNVRRTSSNPAQGLGFARASRPVALDVAPGTCPNLLDPAAGSLPVVIQAGPGVDVNAIETGSIRLAGVAPSRAALRLPPPELDTGCDCAAAPASGLWVLRLEFPLPEVLGALGPSSAGRSRVVAISGWTRQGVVFHGYDCVEIAGDD